MSIYKAVLAVGAIGALIIMAPSAAAQAPAPRSAWALRGTTGGIMPTGDLRQTVKNAQLSGAQLSWAVHPKVAITGSFSWARSRDLISISAPKLDVFTSDVGVELCPKEWTNGRGVSLSSFAGLGVGARSYNYRKLDVDATHNLAGYAAAGGEIGMGRVALRLEVRDYVTGFKPLIGGGKSETGNDVVIMAGLRLIRRQS
jgi:hypothetical protein